VQFAERDMEGPLVGTDLMQTIELQIDAFAAADAGKASEQEGVGKQIVGAAQLPLQSSIVGERERSGKILLVGREVFAANQIRLEGMAIGYQVVEQPAEVN
jgi:hypothetical protein